MNAGRFNNNPPNNIVPQWLQPCTCQTQRCQCNARLRPDILYIRGLSHQSPPPDKTLPNTTIQFIKFTYTNDRFCTESIQRKIDKYQPLINDIQNRGWKIAPLIVI